jgi:hypothetical protein
MVGTTEQDQDYETTQDIENFNANEQLQQLQQLMGGRKHGSRRARSGKGRSGRGRKGGSFLAEITVPVALLAGTQYMKSRYGYGRSKKRNSKRNYRKKSVRRRRR